MSSNNGFIKTMWEIKIGRARFASYFLLVTIVALTLAYLLGKWNLDALLLLTWIVSIIIKLFIAKQRLNDIGKPAWYVLYFLIPLVNFFFLLYMLFKPGANQES